MISIVVNLYLTQLLPLRANTICRNILFTEYLYLKGSWYSLVSPLPINSLSCPRLLWPGLFLICDPRIDNWHRLHEPQTPATSMLSWLYLLEPELSTGTISSHLIVQLINYTKHLSACSQNQMYTFNIYVQFWPPFSFLRTSFNELLL